MISKLLSTVTGVLFLLLVACKPESTEPANDVAETQDSGAAAIVQESGPAPNVHFLTMSGRNLTAEEAELLEKAIEEDPEDVSTRTKLLGYYFGKQFRDQSAREVSVRGQNHPPICG